MDDPSFRFNRMEFAGSLGDLGTLLPIAVGMILINGFDPTGVFITIGLFYLVSGIYFRVPVPVQPMKVIGAYAIATAMPQDQILASGLVMGGLLLFIGASNIISIVGKYVPNAVVRGVQLSTGTLLMVQGLKLMIGTSTFQVMHNGLEPYMSIQHLFGLPIGLIIGIIGGLLALYLLDNERIPAGLAVIVGGLVFGLIFGTHEGFEHLRVGMYLPSFLPFGVPSSLDFTVGLFTLALPQLPMTLGNAVLANADLSKEYFKEKSEKVTYRGLTLSMGLVNIICFFLGGMPLCHGAGGLAAHYRFGARTAGSNLIIGCIFLGLTLFLGKHTLAIIYLMPMSILGILLVFAGSQLAMMVLDLSERKDLFVALLILGIAFATNLAAGFITGIVVSYILKSERMVI